ncbi:MAG: hypothetical protein AAGI12_03255 [Pseudomonadota bacterium]
MTTLFTHRFGNFASRAVIAGPLVAMAFVGPAQALSPLSNGLLQTTLSANTGTTAQKVGFRGTAKEKLAKLLEPHYGKRQFISREIREATGNPNIKVYDWRVGGDWNQCSYGTQNGKRVSLICQ